MGMIAAPWVMVILSASWVLVAVWRAHRAGSLEPLGPVVRMRRSVMAFVLGATALAWVVFGPVFDGFFFNDDWKHLGIVQELAMLSPLGALSQLFVRLAEITDENIRILAYGIWALRVWILGYDPALHHGWALVEHALDATLVMCLTWRLTGRRRAGLAAGALFLVHTVQAETVGYISASEDRLVTGLILFTFLAHLAWRDGRWPRSVAICTTVLALFAKEMALTLPIGLFVLDRLNARKRGSDQPTCTALDSLRAVAPYVLVVVVYLVWRFALFGHMGGYRDGSGGMVHLAFDPASAVHDFLGILVAGLFMPRQEVMDPMVVTPWVLGTWALLLYMAASAKRFSAPALVMGATIMTLAFLPLHNLLVTYQAWENSRYLHLASAGFACMVGSLVAVGSTHPLRDRIRWGCFFVLLIFYGVTARGAVAIVVKSGQESIALLDALAPIAASHPDGVALVTMSESPGVSFPPEIPAAGVYLGIPGRPVYGLMADGKLYGEGPWAGRALRPELLVSGDGGRLVAWYETTDGLRLDDWTDPYLQDPPTTRERDLLELVFEDRPSIGEGSDLSRLGIELSTPLDASEWGVLEVEVAVSGEVDPDPAARLYYGLDIQTVNLEDEVANTLVFSWGATFSWDRTLHGTIGSDGGIIRFDLRSWPRWYLEPAPVDYIGFSMAGGTSDVRLVRATLGSDL